MFVSVTRCTTRTKGQHWSTKHYPENWRSSNTKHTKIRG